MSKRRPGTTESARQRYSAPNKSMSTVRSRAESSRASSRRRRSSGHKSSRTGLTARLKTMCKQKLRRIRRSIINKIKRNKFKTAMLVIGLMLIAAISIIHSVPRKPIQYGNFTHAAEFDGDVIVTGIDVSYAQGDNIDWSKVKKSGIDFVFIRAGFRDASKGNLHEDAKFRQNIKGASDAGLMVGLYLYSQAVSKDEATAEAEYLAKLAAPYKVDLPLVMDYELYNGGRLANAINSRRIGTASINENALAFCKIAESKGYESMIYGNYDFLTNYADGHELAKRTNIWLAQYNTHTTYSGPYSVWQSTDKAHISGISGDVDLNFMYMNPEKTYSSLAKINSGNTSISDCNVQLRKHSSRYIGFAVKPGIDVYHKGNRLSENKDYRVSYVKNTSTGTGYAIVTGIGKYKDRVMTSFKIRGLV